MAGERKDIGFVPAMQTKQGNAEAWGYFSRSGKTLEVYVRPIDTRGNNILSEPVVIVIPSKLFRKVKRGK